MNPLIVNFIYNILDVVSPVILRDFNEIRSLKNSGESSALFALASYRKVAETFLLQFSKLPISASVSLPFFVSSDVKIPTSELLRKSIALSKSKIFDINSNIVYINRKNDESDIKITFNPIDGYSLFAKGLPLFSTSCCYQEKNNNKYETIFSAVYEPITKEIYSTDAVKGALLNKIKIKSNSLQYKQNLTVITNQYEVLSSSFKRKADQFLIIANENLSLCYVASSKADVFVGNIEEEAHVLPGLAIASKAMINNKMTKKENCFEIIAGSSNSINTLLKDPS
jgi:hypothetical protein